MDLALPPHVGPLRASVLCSDRMVLKEQLLQGLWLTQAGGEGGVRNVGEASSARGRRDVAPA